MDENTSVLHNIKLFYMNYSFCWIALLNTKGKTLSQIVQFYYTLLHALPLKEFQVFWKVSEGGKGTFEPHSYVVYFIFTELSRI